MRRRLVRYHVAAVGGEGSDVSVDLVDVLNALGAQGWELVSAVPLKDTDKLLLIVRRAVAETPSPWRGNESSTVPGLKHALGSW